MSDLFNKYKEYINNAFKDSENNVSKLNADILNLKGFSGKKTRHLLNNICSNLSIDNKINYLEIGCWYGSTFISALYNNNNVYGIGIDNWSEFNEGDVEKNFKENINTFLENKNNINIIENNCFNLNLDNLLQKIGNKINFYMFDGNHDYESHKKAITYYKDILDDIFILYIDDWSWERVQNGTYDGLKESNIDILYKLENFSIQDKGGDSTYWNGFGLFICKKI
jgi:hypothetical protein